MAAAFKLGHFYGIRKMLLYRAACRVAAIGIRVNPTISKLHLVLLSGLRDDDLYGTFAQFCVGYSTVLYTTTSFRFATICRHF